MVLLVVRAAGVQVAGLYFKGCSTAIQAQSSSNVYVSSCSFEGHTGSAIKGQAAQVWIQGSSFRRNSHMLPVPTAAEANGGAISVLRSRVLVKGSILAENGALGPGGAIYLDGQPVGSAGKGSCWAEASLVVQDSRMERNSAKWNTTGLGGAIMANATWVRLDNTSLVGNMATYGGAMYLGMGSVAKLAGAQFRGNGARSGGAVYVAEDFSLVWIEGSTFQGNFADMLAGVLMVKGEVMVQVKNSNFVNNTAQIAAGVLYSLGGDVRVDNSSFHSNTAVVKEGGGGGGMYCAGSCHWAISRSNFTKNRCKGNGGAMFGWTMELNLTDTRFEDNTALALGGAVSMANSTVLLQRCDLVRNRATMPDAAGGALYAQSGVLTLEDCKLMSNTAFWGGAVYVTNSTISFKGGQLGKNEAYEAGAAVYTLRTPTMMDQVSFSGNNAQLYGASLYCQEANCTMTGCVVQGEVAAVGAGAVYASGSNLELLDSNFTGCRAKEMGGGVLLARLCDSVRVVGCRFEGNMAGMGPGGAVQFVDTEAAIMNGTVVQNNMVS